MFLIYPSTPFFTIKNPKIKNKSKDVNYCTLLV